MVRSVDHFQKEAGAVSIASEERLMIQNCFLGFEAVESSDERFRSQKKIGISM